LTETRIENDEINMKLYYDDVNYIENISKDQCIDFGEALGEIKKQLLDNYEEGGLVESDLLIVIKK